MGCAAAAVPRVRETTMVDDGVVDDDVVDDGVVDDGVVDDEADSAEARARMNAALPPGMKLGDNPRSPVNP